MCFSKFPFQADAKAQVLKGNFPIPPNRHRAETCQLISRMLTVDPSRRPNIHDVISSTQSLLASPSALPSSSATPVNMPQPVPTPPSHGVPHPAISSYPPAGLAQQGNSPAFAPPLHPQQPPGSPGYMNQRTPGQVPASPPYGSAPGRAGTPQPESAGAAAGGLTHFDPYSGSIADQSALVNGVSDPFAASGRFEHGTGSRPTSAHVEDDGMPLPAGLPSAGHTTASAPVSPLKRVTPPLRQQPFGAGAHTADGVRKPAGELPAGAAAATAEVKQRVFAGQYQNQNLQDQEGVAESPRPGLPQASAAAAAAPSAAVPPFPGVADMSDGGGGDAAVAMMKHSNRLTARKVKTAAGAAAYVAMSGANVDSSVVDGDADEVASALSTLRLENERLKKDLATRMAGGASNGAAAGGPADAAADVVKVRAEAAKALQERDALERKLRTTQEELDQRRLQIGEMRSIIDAINTVPSGGSSGVAAQVAGDSGEGVVTAARSRAASPKKNGNSTTRQSSGFQDMSQRVMAILSETARWKRDTIGWNRRGLRRSVSEVHVAWSDFDDDSPLHT